MGWQDREYAHQDDYRHSVRPMFRGSGMGAYDMVTKLIIANIVVYFFTKGFSGPSRVGIFIEYWGLMQPKAVFSGQIWRLFTATYLHANFMHIFFNMFVLYVFGPMLEHRWGSRQFFIVYTLGGVVANIVLALAGLVTFIPWESWGLGASGSVMTIMAAGAVLFPNQEVLVYFLFPLRLQTIVIVYALAFAYNVFVKKGDNYGGDLCHLAGLAVGYWWARTGGWSWAIGLPKGGGPRPGIGGLFGGSRPRKARFKEKVSQRQGDAKTIDRILAKVSEQGLHSLTEQEKATLEAATERQKAYEAKGGTVDTY